MNSKECPKCKRLLPFTAFNKWSYSNTHGRGDGLQVWCRACQKREHQRTILVRKPKMSEYGKRYRAEHHEELRKKSLVYTENNREARRAAARESYKRRKETVLAWQSEDRKKHRDKYRARDRVNKAVKAGLLVKPSICACGSTERIEAHHYRGYEYPLDVEWVCRICHAKKHRGTV